MQLIETKHLQEVVEKHTTDMKGKVVAITGTTSGTGYVCAREVAKLGATVILLNRKSARSEESFNNLVKEVPNGIFDAIECDLQDFENVKQAAQAIKEKYDVLDVLCNNAGVMALPDQATKDGYDVQMQTNSISPFLLTSELFELLKKSEEARIVNHSSGARLGNNHDPVFFGKNGGDLGGNGTEEENSSFTGPRWERYHQTKLANCTFTYGLKQKIEALEIANVKVMVAHPGYALTNLQTTSAESGGMNLNGSFLANPQSAEDGALGILRGCADPQAQSGDFYGPEGWTGFPEKLEPEGLLLDPQNIKINWDGCEAAVGTFKF